MDKFKGTLYIVATPIGNLKDITLRSIEILQSADVIACEDTRKTGNLLKEISLYSHMSSGNRKRAELLSYYEQNELKRIPEIITLLNNGFNVALVSDSGTPTISDPGFKLVRECISQGLKIESVSGPSSAISALVSSGLPTDKFLFLGFLSKKQGHRKKLLGNVLSSLNTIKSTIIFFEAPHRIVKTLGEIMEIFGDINIVVARELTKVHEEIRREKASSSIAHFKEVKPKGEFVILFHL